ncbi:MAG TPA: MFS transporter, partial [Planctomycetota bacterium]|nr:MFS transporter [Planctomycetota bacterium]
MSAIREAGSQVLEPGGISAAKALIPPDPTPEQKRGMRNTILGQAFGALGQIAFANGLVLLYLTQQEFSGAAIMFFLSLPSLAMTVCLIPAAFIADRSGLKRIIVPGAFLSCIGFALLPLSGLTENRVALTALISAGTVLFAVGIALFSSGWYALLQPLVPPHYRGRYFGVMRVTWQTTGFFFGVLCTFVLSKNSPTVIFQMIFAFVVVGMFTRVIYMSRVPELEKPEATGESLSEALLGIVRVPGYASFCCYVFLITLSTANAPNLFALIAKDALHYGDQTIVWMGNALMIGAVLGFWLGGKAVDRLGTKIVFLLAHFVFGLVLLGFLLRIALPEVAVPFWLGVLNFIFGLVSAASSIAISTEMMALIPQRNKSLSTGLLQTLQVAGA